MELKDFSDTSIAFSGRTNAELRKASLLFSLIRYPWLVSLGKFMLAMARFIHLPVNWLLKPTIFSHFCGGETLEQCSRAVDRLASHGILSIPDYSAEGKGTEQDFERAADETLKVIAMAADHPHIASAVFKCTGLMPASLPEKIQLHKVLSPAEEEAWQRARDRIGRICSAANRAGMRLMIDAEESWIQDTIDSLVEEMMEKYNRDGVVIYHTLQMYRTDRLQYLDQLYAKAVRQGFFIGVKLVRGAYMEKERTRAAKENRVSPVFKNKKGTDEAYNRSLVYCMERIGRISICAGTHNEESSLLLAGLIEKYGVHHEDQRVMFAQLYGMSDHISHNLGASGYFVCKYLPYGPVKKVLPYLIRRADENTAVAGQSGRELGLISEERKRRRNSN